MTAPVVLTPQRPSHDDDAGEAAQEQEQEQGQEQVAMTAPVVMTAREAREGRSMTFLLPAKYASVEEAPVPTNPAVELSMVKGGRCHAVIGFSWNISMSRGEEKANELMAMLERDGVKVVGDWALYGYNSPFVLPWCRRNEVHIPVEVDEAEAEAEAE